MKAMEQFDPEIYLPETDEDRIEIEKALWQGWELQVVETELLLRHAGIASCI